MFCIVRSITMNIEEGLDLSGKTPTALVQRLVPSVFKEPKNILYTLDAREMRDPEHKTEAGRARYAPCC